MSEDESDLLSLNVTEITNALVRPGGLWREVRVVGETGSTNADLLAQAGAGAAEGLVLVAEAQTAARGRLGRRWTSPPRAALTCSRAAESWAASLPSGPGPRSWSASGSTSGRTGPACRATPPRRCCSRRRP